MAPSVNAEVLKDYIVPTIANLSTDPIPNIRFNVAKSLDSITPLILKKFPELNSMLADIVKPKLVKMGEDTDSDVRFFSQKALLSLSA